MLRQMFIKAFILFKKDAILKLKMILILKIEICAFAILIINSFGNWLQSQWNSELGFIFSI